MLSAVPEFTALMASCKVTAPAVGPEGSSPVLFTVIGSGSSSISVALSEVMTGMLGLVERSRRRVDQVAVVQHQSTVPVTV